MAVKMMEHPFHGLDLYSPESTSFHRPASILQERSASRNVDNRDECVEWPLLPLRPVLAFTPTAAPFGAHSTRSLVVPKPCNDDQRTDGEPTLGPMDIVRSLGLEQKIYRIECGLHGRPIHGQPD